MEEHVQARFTVTRDVIEAFQEACRSGGLVADAVIEELMKDFVADRVDDVFFARIKGSEEGEKVEELFSVGIWCDDPLCRSPRIVMDSTAPPKRKGREHPGARKKELLKPKM